MYKAVKKLQSFDAHLASTRIYKAMDAICNILLVFSIFALVIMAVAHQVTIINALNN